MQISPPQTTSVTHLANLETRRAVRDSGHLGRPAQSPRWHELG